MENLSLKDQQLIADFVGKDNRFKYMMLDRLRSDCNYFLGYGNRSDNSLWAKDRFLHIELMKAIHNSFSDREKPEWLTYGQILEFEKQMCK